MTIRNIFYTATYGLWIYILLCLAGKLLLDSIRRAAFTRKAGLIRRYFQAGGLAKVKREKKEQRIARYARNIALLIVACETYQMELPRYRKGEKAALEALIEKMLSTARDAGERTAEERCALANLARSCQVQEWEESAAMEAFQTREKECEQP